MGSSLYFVICVAIFRCFERPYFISGFGILCGYLQAMLNRSPRFDDSSYRKFMRKFELRALVFGKRRAIEHYNRRIHRIFATEPGILATTCLNSALPSGDFANGDGTASSGSSPPGNQKKILTVSSGGGHWIELLRLSPAFCQHKIAYVTVDPAYRYHVGSATFYTVRDVTRWNKLLWLLTAIKLLWILIKEKPDVVISTGALPGYFAIRLARTLKTASPKTPLTATHSFTANG